MKKKHNKGFTLLEMIIAVGLLSIMSVGILKVFLVAKDLNEKSEDVYNSMMLTKNMVALMDGGNFPGAGTSQADSQIFMDHIEQGENDGEYVLGLNENFEPIPADVGQNMPYVWKMSLEKLSKEDLSNEGLYQVDIQVYRNRPYAVRVQEEAPIYQVSMKRFFVGMGEE